MKPHFRSLRHFITARKAYLSSIPVRVDIYAHLRRDFEYRPSRSSRFRLRTLPGT